MIRKLVVALTGSLLIGTASAATWQIRITNVTPGQTFTPILVATHYGEAGVPGVGAAASEGLAILAEAGDTGPLGGEILAQKPHGTDVSTIPGLLGPGQTAETYVDARIGQRLTVAAMLIPTNDTFFAVGSEFLLPFGETTIHALAYDAGSEGNDQNCANIPGPRCGGEGYSAVSTGDEEGYVHVSNGFHDLGDEDAEGNEILGPVHYSWNNPVAIVTIRRVFRH